MATRKKKTTRRKPTLASARQGLATSARNLEKTAGAYDTADFMKKKYDPKKGINDPTARRHYTKEMTAARKKHNQAKKTFDRAQRTYRKRAGRT